MQIFEFESPTLDNKGEIITRTRRQAEQFTEELGSEVSLDMLIIPSGIFQMGSTRHLGHADEEPQHLVTIKSFMMSKYLITQGQWKAIMGKLPPCRFKGDNLQRNARLVEALSRIASDRGVTPSQLAVAWVLAKGPGIVPLIGARTRTQLVESLAALQIALTPSEVERIEAALPPADVAGARYDEHQMRVLDSEREGASK